MQRSESELIKALQQVEETESGRKAIKQCKVCKEYKLKISDGKRPDNRNTRFIGECGKEWNGRVCPKCHTNDMCNHMNMKRTKV